MYFEQLHDKLYAKMQQTRRLADVLGDFLDCWRGFCDLPEDVRRRFTFPDHQTKHSDPGYKERTPADGRDQKWYFHYVPDNPRLVEHYGLLPLLEQYPLARRFFAFAAAVDAAAYTFALNIAGDLDAHIPGIRNQVERGRQHFVYRYLHYTAPPSEENLAAPHFDRSGFTLNLQESGPGLQVLDWNGEWINVRVHPGEAAMLAGHKLEVATGGIVQKAFHRVVRQGAAKHGVKRASLVLFVPLIDVPGYEKGARSQEMTPGYQPRKSIL